MSNYYILIVAFLIGYSIKHTLPDEKRKYRILHEFQKKYACSQLRHEKLIKVNFRSPIIDFNS